MMEHNRLYHAQIRQHIEQLPSKKETSTYVNTTLKNTHRI